MEEEYLPHQLIKQKSVADLINGNRAKTDINRRHTYYSQNMKPVDR